MNENDIYVLHYSHIRAIALSYFNHRAVQRDASITPDDLIQEAGVALVKAIRTYRTGGPASFRTYYNKIGHNHMRDYVKSLGSKSRGYSLNSPHFPEEAAADLPAKDFLAEIDMRRSVKRAVQKALSPEDAELVLMYFGLLDPELPEKTLTQLEAEFGVSASRLSILIRKALRSEELKAELDLVRRG